MKAGTMLSALVISKGVVWSSLIAFLTFLTAAFSLISRSSILTQSMIMLHFPKYGLAGTVAWNLRAISAFPEGTLYSVASEGFPQANCKSGVDRPNSGASEPYKTSLTKVNLCYTSPKFLVTAWNILLGCLYGFHPPTWMKSEVLRAPLLSWADCSAVHAWVMVQLNSFVVKRLPIGRQKQVSEQASCCVKLIVHASMKRMAKVRNNIFAFIQNIFKSWIVWHQRKQLLTANLLRFQNRAILHATFDKQ